MVLVNFNWYRNKYIRMVLTRYPYRCIPYFSRLICFEAFSCRSVEILLINISSIVQQISQMLTCASLTHSISPGCSVLSVDFQMVSFNGGFVHHTSVWRPAFWNTQLKAVLLTDSMSWAVDLWNSFRATMVSSLTNAVLTLSVSLVAHPYLVRCAVMPYSFR